MVEPSLSEHILRVWQRSHSPDDNEASEIMSVQSRLKKLMNFLRKEVADEKMISIALFGFDLKTMKKNVKETFTSIGLPQMDTN